MIKLVFCLRRLPTLSASEFQRYWHDNHAELVRRHADALGIRRYTQSHTFTAYVDVTLFTLRSRFTRLIQNIDAGIGYGAAYACVTGLFD